MILKGIGIVLLGCASLVWAGEQEFPLDKAPVDVSDKASLQRGWRIFANYCQGCHSLQYARYQQVARDLDIVDASGEVPNAFLKKMVVFSEAKTTDPMVSAMNPALSKKWFGVSPPDLTLEARVRGADWIYTYLRNFYLDPEKPWGVNNRVFPDVAMPHVLEHLQGTFKPIMREETHILEGKPHKVSVIDHLELIHPGTMTQAQFDAAMGDLVNFLVYMGEPVQLERQRLGVKVLLFLVFFTALAYALKKEYWKDVQ